MYNNADYQQNNLLALFSKRENRENFK